MGFETPAYLWGALAAAIPLLLHLINRRRAKIIDFAAIEFILASNRRIARRLKLKQWLLLLMRMLLIAALPIAFAKPYVTTGEEALPATGAPVSVVFVIDPSFSMGYRVGEETLLDRAREKALDIIADLRYESDAAVVLAGTPARALTPRLTFDRGDLRRAVESIEQTHARADIQGALRLAEQILVTSGLPRREVVLLTDLQATEWEGIVRPWSLERSPRVTLLDMRPDADRPNGAITRVRAEPAPGGRSVRVDVEILNDRPGVFEDVITVRVAGRTAKGIVKVPPRQKAQKEFSIRLPDTGPVGGVVEVPADDLPGDNTAPLVIDFLRRVQVLIVNGAPRSVPHRDEAFFLRAALLPGRDSGSRLSPTTVKPDELTPAQLSYVDVVILANVAELDAAQAQALRSWVEKGGGLLITSGENVTAETYNSVLRELVPLPIRDVRDANAESEFFTGVEVTHPALAVFSHLPDASLFAARTHRYVLLETAAGDTRVLASYTSGAPALVEREVGEGRLMMLTTSIDKDWTDLPFKTSFLPLVQHLVLHLAGKLERHGVRELVVGEPTSIAVGRDVAEIRVVRPDGREVSFSGVDLAAGQVRFRETDLAGIYAVRQFTAGSGPENQRKREESRFAVHIDPRESDLRGSEQGALEVVLEAAQAGAGVARPTTKPAPSRRGELWPMLLIALFVLLGFETWLAFQFGA